MYLFIYRATPQFEASTPWLAVKLEVHGHGHGHGPHVSGKSDLVFNSSISTPARAPDTISV